MQEAWGKPYSCFCVSFSHPLEVLFPITMLTMTLASKDNIGEECVMTRSQAQVHSVSAAANSCLAQTLPPLLMTFLVQCSAELQYMPCLSQHCLWVGLHIWWEKPDPPLFILKNKALRNCRGGIREWKAEWWGRESVLPGDFYADYGCRSWREKGRFWKHLMCKKKTGEEETLLLGQDRKLTKT